MACELVQRAISAGDRRALRGRRLRAHLDDCSNCGAFEAALESRPAALAALTPLLPAASAAALLQGIIGAGSGGGNAAAGVGGAAVCVLLAIPLAVLAARWPGRLAVVVERITYAAYAVPGIALALAVVFLTANAVPFAYQTFAVLVLAYGVRFLAQAVAPMRNALWQIGPHLGEAARGLGRRPIGVLVSVTLPLVRPGLVAAAALVFLSTVKELPITLLLAPTGFDTLAVRIWSATSEGFFARAALPALLMVVVAAASLWFVLRQERGR
jgi:iron(III) transport system permease protein